MVDATRRALGHMMTPAGPVLNDAVASGFLEDLRLTLIGEKAREEDLVILDRSRDALKPIIAASSYLSSLMRRHPLMLIDHLGAQPLLKLEEILEKTKQLASHEVDCDDAKSKLRYLKSAIHLLCALCDLGGVWDLELVTSALSRFADEAAKVALFHVAAEETRRTRLLALSFNPAFTEKNGPIPGLFILAMGKQGAFELNYSSDIDITFFCDMDVLPVKHGEDAQTLADRIARQVSLFLSERTKDGYVFRVDLRLRPDPSSTPSCVSVSYALNYYETVGQNWERAAYIKARPIAGDMVQAESFMNALKPFVWRRSLDFPAIADVQSIMRQIHIHKASDRLEPAGANLKLGAGGIREIEFFVQTQQLILGGRDASLRSRQTLDALDALRKATHIVPAIAKELKIAYQRLRSWEHRIQMIYDEQTHDLPEDDDERTKISALSGFTTLSRFDLLVSRTIKRVNEHYGTLFTEDESLASRFGSLVFTGVDHDPQTLKTLERLGFDEPEMVSHTIRSWHHGRISATRSERGRELFTKLVPKLLEALNETGISGVAFKRFSVFFSSLKAGVQIQSLFLANPRLFRMVVDIMGLAPRLAKVLGQYPTVFDAMLDAGFFDDAGDEFDELIKMEISQVPNDLEAVMNGLRRVAREQKFRIGMQIFNNRLTSEVAGAAYCRLADATMEVLAPLCLQAVIDQGGAFDGKVAVIALGKFGSREMTATSDLDLMVVYQPKDILAMSEKRGWGAETFYARFTQRLISALSAPTLEGGLYEIDMKLRPSGSKGPVAVSLNGFLDYYLKDAQTWEFLALTRARIVWSSDEDFSEEVRAKIETLLRTPRDDDQTLKDVSLMRALLDKEKKQQSQWDLKRGYGGLMECELMAQTLQLLQASKGGPLRTSTVQSLDTMMRFYPHMASALADVKHAWLVQQGVMQLMRVCLNDPPDPSAEPEEFQARLARTVRTRRLDTLVSKLKMAREKATLAFDLLCDMKKGQ